MLSFEPISLFKWQIFFQMEESFKMQTHMGMGASDIDELKARDVSDRHIQTHPAHTYAYRHTY